MKDKQISNGILIALIIGCILLLLFSSCTVSRKAMETEPIGPYHIGDPLTLYQVDGVAKEVDMVWGGQLKVDDSAASYGKGECVQQSQIITTVVPGISFETFDLTEMDGGPVTKCKHDWGDCGKNFEAVICLCLNCGKPDWPIECDHFWIKSAIEISDPFWDEFKDGETMYGPCICLYCKTKSICK